MSKNAELKGAITIARRRELSVKIDYLSMVFETIDARELIQRVLGGKYVAPSGTSPEKLSLKPGTDTSMYNEYKIVIEIPGVEKAKIAPWFDQPGGGTQYKLPKSIDVLLAEEYIELIIK